MFFWASARSHLSCQSCLFFHLYPFIFIKCPRITALFVYCRKNVDKVIGKLFNAEGATQEEFLGELVSAYAMERNVKYSKVIIMSEERFGSEIDFILEVNKDKYGENTQGAHELEEGAYLVESKTEGLGTDLDIVHDQLLAHDMDNVPTMGALANKPNKTKLENYPD